VLKGCGLIVLALPLNRLLEPDPALRAALPAEAVVTDVGSVKQPVLERWGHWHPRFVASHPMAGTAQAGVEAGLEGLFTGRPWVATPASAPLPATDPAALDLVQQLAQAVGARWLTCAAAAHDQAVALISHMPVLVSAALLQAADRGSSPGSTGSSELTVLVRALASSGFADTTRVGGGNPELGTLMARCNQEALLLALASYRTQLNALEERILRGDWQGLQRELESSQALRPEFMNWSDHRQIGE
jgi:arogenate dehydrogenase (NADP+)